MGHFLKAYSLLYMATMKNVPFMISYLKDKVKEEYSGFGLGLRV